MTLLSPVAGAQPSAPPASGSAKASTPDTGFQAAFDKATTGLPVSSGTEQPAKSDKGRKPTDKDENTSSAKENGSAPRQDPLVSLLVPPMPIIPSLPVQAVVRGPENRREAAGTSVSGTDSAPAASAPEQATGGLISGLAPDSMSALLEEGEGKTADKLDALPAQVAARNTQSEDAASQPLRAETQEKTAAGQAASANNVLSPGDGSATPQSAASLPLNAAARTVLKAAVPPSSLLKSAVPIKAAGTAGSSALLHSAGVGERAEPLTAASQAAPSSRIPEHAGNANASGDGSDVKDNAGSGTPATPLSGQPLAAPQNVVAGQSMSSVMAAHAAPIPLSSTAAALQAPAMHAAESTSAPTALPQINTARVLGSMGGTELRVGMHSQEFGSVSIATSVSPGGVAAQIALDHGDLSKALAAHLPGIEEKLGHTLGVQARVEVLNAGAGQSGQNGAPREGARQDRGFSSSSAAASSREPYLAQTAPPAAVEQAGSGLRLSVRA